MFSKLNLKYRSLVWLKTMHIYYGAALEVWGFLGSSAGKESTCNAGDPSSIHGLGRSPEEERIPTPIFLGFLCAQLVKNTPAM